MAVSSLTGCWSAGLCKPQPSSSCHCSWEKHYRGTGSFTKPRASSPNGKTSSSSSVLPNPAEDRVASPPGHIECHLLVSLLEAYCLQFNFISRKISQTLEAEKHLSNSLVTCFTLQQSDPSPEVHRHMQFHTKLQPTLSLPTNRWQELHSAEFLAKRMIFPASAVDWHCWALEGNLPAHAKAFSHGFSRSSLLHRCKNQT